VVNNGKFNHNCLVVVYLPTLLKNDGVMDFSWDYVIPNWLWKVIIQPCSSHHQEIWEYHAIHGMFFSCDDKKWAFDVDMLGIQRDFVCLQSYVFVWKWCSYFSLVHDYHLLQSNCHTGSGIAYIPHFQTSSYDTENTSLPNFTKPPIFK
jgi:hypothetical protein